MKKHILTAFALCGAMASLAQQAPEKTEPKLTISGYAEAYYVFDFNKPDNHTRPGFLYNHTRHNELNINLAMLKASYVADRVRGNLAIMAGTYAQYNMASEQELIRHIYEANVGIRIGKGLWVDAGIMPSHIGFESAIGKDNFTLTRSLMAENSPITKPAPKSVGRPTPNGYSPPCTSTAGKGSNVRTLTRPLVSVPRSPSSQLVRLRSTGALSSVTINRIPFARCAISATFMVRSSHG